VRLPERQTLQLQCELPTAVEKVRSHNITAARAEGLEGRRAERIDQGRDDFVRVEKRRIRESLVQVCPVGLPHLVSHALPAGFVQLSEMSFILGVEDSKLVVTAQHQVWD
jgi:hypothetical protein